MAGGVATNKERLLSRLRAETCDARNNPAKAGTTACRHAAEGVRRPDRPLKPTPEAWLPADEISFILCPLSGHLAAKSARPDQFSLGVRSSEFGVNNLRFDLNLCHLIIILNFDIRTYCLLRACSSDG
jgi:hypothetical protein